MSTAPENDVPLETITLVIIVVGIVVVYATFFIAGLQGVLAQLADPAGAVAQTNPAIFPLVYPFELAAAYTWLPELTDSRVRLTKAAQIAIVPTFVVPVVLTGVLVSVAHPHPWSLVTTIAAAFLVFGGVLPLFLTRVLVLASPQQRLTRAKDHVVDPGALCGQMARIVEKHTHGTFRRPAGWGMPTLWGQDGRLTHRDLQKMLALEIAQQERLRAMHEARADRVQAAFAAACATRRAAAPERALALEARARGEVEAMAAALSEAQAQNAALRAETQSLRTALQEKERAASFSSPPPSGAGRSRAGRRRHGASIPPPPCNGAIHE